MRTIELPPQGQTRVEMKKATKKPPKKAVAPPQPAAPKPVAPKASERKTTTKKSAAPAAFKEPSHPIPEQRSESLYRTLPGSGAERDPEKLAGNAYHLSQACISGIPEEFPVEYHADVLALVGVDLAIAETTVRRPERVVIAEQTGEKGYPVLRFHRGSVVVAVGFRDAQPMILAVYLAEQIDRTRAASGTSGSGGSRRKEGVPRTVAQLVKRLKELGVTFDQDEEHPVVLFEGNDLGKITLTRVRSKDDIESDWQRIQRKVDAIQRRA